jgi:hypothetical protein
LIGTKEGLYEINITKDIKGMAVIFKHEVLNDTVPNPENDDDIELEEVFEPYFKEKTVRFTQVETSKGLRLLISSEGEESLRIVDPLNMKIEAFIRNGQASKSKTYLALRTIPNTSWVVLRDDQQISLVDIEGRTISKICDSFLSIDTSRKHSLEIVEEGENIQIYTIEYTNKTK